MNIRVLPPDINRSAPDFSLEDDAQDAVCIRYALAAVKKVGMTAMQAVVDARGEREFSDIADFAARVDAKEAELAEAKSETEHRKDSGGEDEDKPLKGSRHRHHQDGPKGKRPLTFYRRNDNPRVGMEAEIGFPMVTPRPVSSLAHFRLP